MHTLPHDLSTKTRLISASVYPAAFFGCELVPLGTAHVDQIRPELATALYGNSASRNSAVAIHLTPKIIDPQIYVIYQALCAARYFLITAPIEQQRIFCNIVATHTGTHSDCHGPAGCLKYYIMKFGWQFTDTGQIHIDIFSQLTFGKVPNNVCSLSACLHGITIC